MKVFSAAVLLLVVSTNVSRQFVAAAPTKRIKKSLPTVPGINQMELYNRVSKAFVGLSPKLGDGSGFIIRDIKNVTSFGNAPDSGGPRVDLCTCNCKAGDNRVGCTGTGGVNFRYSSLLWMDPFDGRWTGQMQAFQAAAVDLHFLGSDTRLYPLSIMWHVLSRIAMMLSQVFSARPTAPCLAMLES
jgi:hypothetical protein